jgi:hypothetical protein
VVGQTSTIQVAYVVRTTFESDLGFSICSGLEGTEASSRMVGVTESKSDPRLDS